MMLRSCNLTEAKEHDLDKVEDMKKKLGIVIEKDV